MATLTLTIPEDLKNEMENYKVVNWSELVCSAINEKLAKLRILKAISAKSKFSEEDALKLGRKINKSLHEKLEKVL